MDRIEIIAKALGPEIYLGTVTDKSKAKRRAASKRAKKARRINRGA